ncbi:bifunctional (p)ppGpp synthetase/guanosine-3',5'-bis(diphosphate) 3'-pyrophosphohydrolase [Candidatus Microgenomates bacterium]|nr:MAG: bifunctional (p)ppGpp synthetase/guanosine-3',5'-bis(diphosphate) 3'-pyrophosphohydrolase [Candidatus Microgenomates bacterium]
MNRIYEVIKQKGLVPNEEGAKKLARVWEFAKTAHEGQKRMNGDEYVEHSLEVALLLASWGLDIDAICAGLLHDTVEDGVAKRDEIVKLFGEDVAALVDGVTKVGTVRLNKETEEHFVENFRKMILYMARDTRVVIIKLADRLHNMRTLSAVKKEKQKRIAMETLEIYAPLAERLGMGSVKGELEDLAFKYVYPISFKKLTAKSHPYYKEAEEHIYKIKKTLLRSLANENIKAHVNGRKKHLYSLWRKLERDKGEWDFENIHDIVALRIILDTPTECYTALGVVHTHFKPVPSIGVSDFIAQPKPNGYQSIHTKVFGPGGRFVEIQIRTKDMHEQAEYGVAAHWAYSQAKAKGASDKSLEGGDTRVSKDKLDWVRQLVEWQKEFTDNKDYLNAVRFDGLNHRNFVFSPKGDVYDLPQGATPVDFAFAIHTNLGRFIRSAKVNGKMAPLHYVLKSGDVVEILKSKTQNGPHRAWLDFVVTTAARREIQKHKRRSSHG